MATDGSVKEDATINESENTEYIGKQGNFHGLLSEWWSSQAYQICKFNNLM